MPATTSAITAPMPDTVPTATDTLSGLPSPTLTTSDKQPSKSETVLKLLRRKRGATLAELQAATGWQAHSVRGFLSGTVGKRLKLPLTAEPGSDGVRRYAVAKG